MSRWTALYDELAGARYPGLVGYAGLLTSDTPTADALVASALRRTFVKPRKFAGVSQAEHAVRQAIVTEFLARESAAGSAPSAGDGVETLGSAAPSPDAPRDDRTAPSDAPWAGSARTDERANPYAPPGDDRDHDAAVDRTAQARSDDKPARASAPAPEDRAATTAAREGAVARETDVSRDEGHLRAALQTLPARSRVVALLRYYDGLTPGQIGERLGLPMETVLPALHQTRDVARVHLGVMLADDAFEIEPTGAAEVTVADHARRAAS